MVICRNALRIVLKHEVCGFIVDNDTHQGFVEMIADL